MTGQARHDPYDGEFAGATVVITGAAGIIGGWIADAFAALGARLVLCDLRDALLHKQVQQRRWERTQVTVCATICAARSRSTRSRRWSPISPGRPMSWVNNAGVYPHAPLLDVDRAEWDG